MVGLFYHIMKPAVPTTETQEQTSWVNHPVVVVTTSKDLTNVRNSNFNKYHILSEIANYE